MKTLEETIKNLLYETHKLSNGQPSIAVLERMDNTAKMLAKELDSYLDAKYVKQIRPLQDEIIKAFDLVEKSIEALNEKIKDTDPYRKSR
jgi:actin-like ATPase involved in cell morphogenesis